MYGKVNPTNSASDDVTVKNIGESPKSSSSYNSDDTICALSAEESMLARSVTSTLVKLDIPTKHEQIEPPIEENFICAKEADYKTKRRAKRLLKADESLPYMYLLDWLEENSDKHIIHYLAERYVKYQERNELSDIKKKTLNYSLVSSLTLFLEACEHLTPDEIKSVFLYDESKNECGLLESLQKGPVYLSTFFKTTLFSAANDNFLHSVTKERIGIFTETKSRILAFFGQVIKYLLAVVYPVIYIFILVLWATEIIIGCCTSNGQSETSTFSKIKKFRHRVENTFSDPNILCCIHWFSNVWFFILLVLYMISYFGSGFDTAHECYCNYTDASNDNFNAGLTTIRDLPPAPDSSCNVPLYQALNWIACRNELDVTQVRNYDVCITDTDWINTKYPNVMMKNTPYSETKWETNPDKYQLVDVEEFLANFKNSHYGYCELYEDKYKKYEELFRYHKYMETNHLNNSKNPWNIVSKDYDDNGVQDRPYAEYSWSDVFSGEAFLNVNMSDVDSNLYPATERDVIFFSYQDLFGHPTHLPGGADFGSRPLIHNSNAESTLLIMLFVIVVTKACNEFASYLGCSSVAKYFIDQINMIDVVHILSSFGYLVSEEYRKNSRVDDFASTVFFKYEVAARTLEIIVILTTMILIITIFPKLEIYSMEINSVIDMLVLGLRYMVVLCMLLAGLLFSGQNLYRRAINLNRMESIRNGDYVTEETLTKNMDFTSLDTFSLVIRNTEI